MITPIKKILAQRKGQALVEYSLILGLILVVVVAAINLLGLQANKAFFKVVSAMTIAGF